MMISPFSLYPPQTPERIHATNPRPITTAKQLEHRIRSSRPPPPSFDREGRDRPAEKSGAVIFPSNSGGQQGALANAASVYLPGLALSLPPRPQPCATVFVQPYLVSIFDDRARGGKSASIPLRPADPSLRSHEIHNTEKAHATSRAF